MKFNDKVTLGGTRRRNDGSLVAEARVARTGIQTYLGSEVGVKDKATVRVYRPGSEVFSDETMASVAHKPVTNDHPPVLVDSTNWKDFARGQTGDEVTGESIYIRVPLMVSDEATIQDVMDGKRELSAGYTCDLDFTPGETPGGESYDAVQRNIRVNHIAIVKAGRAGNEVRIGDGAGEWGIGPVTADERDPEMPDNLRNVLVDGLPISTTDAGATAIEKLLNDRAADRQSLANAIASHATAIGTKDKEIATKDGEIDGLKKKVADLEARDIDKLVADRADLVARAKVLVPTLDVKGKSAADIRRTVVIAKIGDAAVKDKSDEYVEARFDGLVPGTTLVPAQDAFRAALIPGITPPGNVVEDAYKAMIDRQTKAWVGDRKAG